MYTLIEPCCGSASLTLHLLGARRTPVPYQGSKWRYRRALADLIGRAEIPRRIMLTDPGPWGRVFGTILHAAKRRELISKLRKLAQPDPRTVYDLLQAQSVPDGEIEFAAEFLFLQRLAFSGKAVAVHNGRWYSPGFNTTSAYGTPGTDRFGPVKPMVQRMIYALDSYILATGCKILAVQQPAQPVRSGMLRTTVVYIDPPYEGSTAYPNGTLSRQEVIDLALSYRNAGASVIVSEAEPLPIAGWKKAILSPGRVGASPFKGKQVEWVTYTPDLG